MIRTRFLAALIAAALLTPLIRAQDSDPLNALDSRFVNGIAAIVEDRVITVEEVKREIRPLLEQLQRQARNQREFDQQLATVQQEVIQSLVDRILLVKEFDSKGMQIPASFIEARFNDALAEQFGGDRARFLAHLRERGITTRDFRREIEDRVKVGFMRAQMNRSQSVVSPVKIEQFYQQHRDRFRQEDGVKLRLIRLTQLADEGPEVLRQTADSIVADLRRGADFAELARRHSQDARARDGGDWGWVSRGSLSPVLAEAAFALERGQFTDPISIGKDLFILMAEDRRHEGFRPIDEVRPEIERFLAQALARESQERMLERLRGRYFIRYF
jgi:peptidyl-prolyl cis-trans isomerase SurA